MELYNTYKPYLHLGLTIYSGITYYFIENKLTIINIITGYTLIDTLINPAIINSYDYLLHHLLILLSYLTFKYYNYTDFIHVTITPVLSFNISSIFLTLDTIYKNNLIYDKIKYVNLLCFVSTFCYYRLYRYYYDTIIHPDFIIFLNTYNNCIGLITYIFFSLNIFWICIIIKKICNPLKKINTNVLTKYICQYALFINVFISLYKLVFGKNTINLLQLFGNLLLSITNYNYHNNLLLNEVNNYPIEDKYLIYNHISIRIKNSLCLLTYLPYNNIYSYISIYNHLISSILSLHFLNNDRIIHKKNIQLWLNISLIMDKMVLAYNNNNTLHMYIILLIINISQHNNILYNFTPILIHIIYILQNILMINVYF